MTSSSAIPYIGSKISLVTVSELRYDGILVHINTGNSTVTLKDVRMIGSENRKGSSQYVMPCSEVFDYIIFNGRDIKDLTVSEPAFSIKEDPAVVAVNVAPPAAAPGQQNGLCNILAGYPNHLDSMYGPPRGHPGADSGYGHQAPKGFSPIHHQAAVASHGRGGPINYGNRRDAGYHHHQANGGYDPQPQAHRGFGRARLNITNRAVVGELSAQPNPNLKTQVAKAFDFEQSNSKFEKGRLENSAPNYDKKASFFDNISCESLNRQHGRDSKVDRERQRELDAETFGPAATLTRGPRYYRRGARRPALRGRGGASFGTGPMYGLQRSNVQSAYQYQPNQMLRAQ